MGALNVPPRLNVPPTPSCIALMAYLLSLEAADTGPGRILLLLLGPTFLPTPSIWGLGVWVWGAVGGQFQEGWTIETEIRASLPCTCPVEAGGSFQIEGKTHEEKAAGG